MLSLSQIIGVMVTILPSALGCPFHCNTSKCGGTIKVVVFPFLHGNKYIAGGEIPSVNLSSRNITSFLPGAFDCWQFGGPPDFPYGILLDNNPLGIPSLLATMNPGLASMVGAEFVSLANCSIRNITASDIRTLFSLADATRPMAFTGNIALRLPYNNLTQLPERALNGLNGSSLKLDLSHNHITGISNSFFFGALVTSLSVSFNNNWISTLQPRILNGFEGDALTVEMSNNFVQELPADLFGGLTLSTRYLTWAMTNNTMLSASSIFGEHFVIDGSVMLDLGHNSLQAYHLSAIVSSWRNANGGLTLNLTHNALSELPDETFYSVVSLSTFTLDATHNPVRTVKANFFSAASNLQFVTIDISFTTGLKNLTVEDLSFVAVDNPSFVNDGSLSFIAKSAGVTARDIVAFNQFLQPSRCSSNLTTAVYACVGGCPSCALALDWSSNNITLLQSGALAQAYVSNLTLKDNDMNFIAGDAFNYTFSLKILDLSNNQLSFISTSLQDNTPALQSLRVRNNSILAIAAHRNGIVEDNAATENPLLCSAYGPSMMNCVCTNNMTFGIHCGYARCSASCPSGLVWNSTSCSDAPFSSCVNVTTVMGRQYYAENIGAFLPVTNCRTAFPSATGYHQAYQFGTFTASTDRLCSICSTCPAGFSTSPCTATTDSKCTKENQLSPGDISAIVMAIVLVIVAGSMVATYLYTTKKRELGVTKSYLQLTEKLLGEEKEEKNRYSKAWSIAEQDLTFGEILGVGGFGRVYRGTWGHIPVAIKVLLHPVSFMRSVRHPHILTFFGAGQLAANWGGMESDSSHAFLVTELMSRGSLKSLLRDHSVPLRWAERLQFAVDAAVGMRYLHDIGTVHRDLKADNCFVDAKMRVKIADFGTGRFATDRTVDEKRSSHREDWALTSDRGRTLSKGVGSLLFMAPEVLRGDRITTIMAPKLDVYSYAILLFEIWTREVPWGEIEECGVHFPLKLQELTTAGQRPVLPVPCQSAPAGFEALMQACWVGDPAKRPTFAAIVLSISAIRESLHPHNYATDTKL
eukprot:m.187131 g.187131  ORF g.187131 m.187131 type:complete len:1037 (+) comp15068_c0_seq7:243-3353(+)